MRAEKSRPSRETEAAEKSADAGADTLSLTPSADLRLPCRGCDPYRCPPGCGRDVLLVEYGTHDVTTLGLAPHDRALCRHCKAVAS